MAEQESIQTQLDFLRYDFTEQKKYSDEMAARFASFGRLNFMTLEAMQKFADKTATQHEAFVVDTCKALATLHAIVNNQHQELHLLRDTVASLQQDVATLEEKFSLMEEVTNVTVSLDETDEGGAERAEMDYERRWEQEQEARGNMHDAMDSERFSRPFDPGYEPVSAEDYLGD